MKLINKKHDLINIEILDQTEYDLPDIGLIKLNDVENKTSLWIDTAQKNNQVLIAESFSVHKKILDIFCKKNKIDLISINSKEGYLQPLINFFNIRINRQ